MSIRPTIYPSWRAGWRKPDRRPIWDWAHDNVTLPASYAQPGRLDLSTSRHLLAPLAAIQDDAVREVTNMGAIQTGKSLVSEVAILWALANSPGPMMLTMQTDEDAREHCNQRFFEALKSVPGIREIMPRDRHAMTMTEIYFGPFFLMVNGANLSNLQRVSIRWKFNSEVWLWKQGLLAHARGRVSAFEKAGNSKVINESQGGTDGDDFHEAYKAGHQAEWAVKCFGCGKRSPLAFSCTREDGKKLELFGTMTPGEMTALGMLPGLVKLSVGNVHCVGVVTEIQHESGHNGILTETITFVVKTLRTPCDPSGGSHWLPDLWQTSQRSFSKPDASKSKA